MKKITLRQHVLMLLLMIAGYATAQNPAITELYGRYKLSGECVLQNATVPAETDYEVAILPGNAEGQVKVQGILGYSGAVNLVYDQENGTLTSPLIDLGDGNPIFPGGMLCGTYMTMYMAMQMTPASFTVAMQDGSIVITSTDMFIAAIGDPDAELTEEQEEEGALAMYAPGTTLTKMAVNKPITEVVGTYDLKGDYLDFMLVEDASESFKLTVAEKEGAENTLILSGLFGIENASVEAQYLPESGLIVMPMAAEMPNGMYLGFSPTSEEDMGMMNYNDQPIFFAGDNTLSSPSFFILDNGVDVEMGMPLLFSFLRAQATKEVSAIQFPAITELYGRYKLSGECTLVDFTVPAKTDYYVAILPGATEGQVVLHGLFGNSSTTLVYDQEEGTLKNIVVDGTVMPPYLYGSPMGFVMGLAGNALDLSVANDGNGIVLTSNTDYTAQFMDFMLQESGMATYAQGMTLTKEVRNTPISDATGTYNLQATALDMPLIEEASDEFTFSIKEKEGEENKLIVNGFFGMNDVQVEADYIPESGIIVLPFECALSNGMFFGVNPEGEHGLMNTCAQPIFFVEKDALTSPSLFVLDNGVDEDLEAPVLFSFLTATATKDTESGTGIHTTIGAAGQLNISAQDNALRVESAEATDIRVFNAQGAAVGTAHSTAATFSGLPAGIYIVKAGERSLKVVVK